jgi:hypothetical protein
VKAFKADFFPEIGKLIVVGRHAEAVRRMLIKRFAPGSLQVCRTKDPWQVMKRVFEMTEKNSLVIGLGNMSGMGEAMCDHWNSIGEPYGL